MNVEIEGEVFDVTGNRPALLLLAGLERYRIAFTELEMQLRRNYDAAYRDAYDKAFLLAFAGVKDADHQNVRVRRVSRTIGPLDGRPGRSENLRVIEIVEEVL